ncbi:MAG TPA: hypothetical protein PK074_09305 [Spirochaetales bacterium]|nr:hypothetical protein [Spirochaetales bacterium]
MAKYYIRYNDLQNQAEALQKISRTLASFESRINAIANAMDSRDSNMASIRNKVKACGEVVFTLKNCTILMEGTIKKTNAIYLTVEKSIFEDTSNIQIPSFGKKGLTYIFNQSDNMSQSNMLGIVAELPGILIGGINTLSKNETTRSMMNLGGTDGTNKIDVSFFGYKLSEDEFNGHILKLTGTSKQNLNGVDIDTEGYISIGGVRGSSEVSFDVFKSSKKEENKTGMSYDSSDAKYSDDGFTDYDGEMKSKSDLELLNLGIAASVGCTIAEFGYKTTIGDANYGGTVDVNVKVLDADAGMTAGIKIDEDGLSAKVKGEVGVSLAEVESNVSVRVAGVETEAKVSAECGVGIYGEFGYSDGEINLGFGAALGIGGKVKLTIKVPDLELPWW